MKRTDFSYHLPEERIAQQPVTPRDAARMMVLDRGDGRIRHHIFRDIVGLVPPRTMIVVNNTRVFPARLHLVKRDTGARIEIFLLRQLDDHARRWRCLVRPAKRVQPGTVLTFPDETEAVIRENHGEGIHEIDITGADPFQRITTFGETPLPPYIKRTEADPSDRERYQTVFAEKNGAVAAPTAGFHFTRRVLQALDQKGVPVIKVTLYVGLGTFRPVTADDIRDHRMDVEAYEISPEAADAINQWKDDGGRILAVGTTAVRTLEGCVARYGEVRAVRDETDIFIYPPFRFQVVDHLLTNFHLPESTLLMLVSAFAGRERVLEAYREAVDTGYRFYSYGDCMLIL